MGGFHQRISLGIHGRDSEDKAACHWWDWRIIINIAVALSLENALPKVFYFLEARVEELIRRHIFFKSLGEHHLPAETEPNVMLC